MKLTHKVLVREPRAETVTLAERLIRFHEALAKLLVIVPK